MIRPFLVFATCTILVGCGDPLADVDRLSSVDLADDVASVGALQAPESAEETRGLLSGLFGRRNAPAAISTDIAFEAAPAKDGDVAPAVETALVTAPVRERRGLFGFMRAKAGSAPAMPMIEASAPLPDAPSDGLIEQAVAVAPDKALDVTQGAPEASARSRRGLFGLLAGARAKDQSQTAGAAGVQTASLGPVQAPARNNDKPSLFAKPQRAHKGPDAQIVPFGTTLPAGAVARVCDLPNGRLGKEVGKFPERGRGYKMFDSNSGASGARPFYVTGFDDGCARTFTAALALFGSPTMHEQLRYGLPSTVQPYSTTDKAYEGIKQSICGVARKKACGAKIGLLEKDTAFISIYDRIGSNSKWSNLLLHKGWLLAADRKG